MPPNTVKVDRSTGWGNPYRIGDDLIAFGGKPAIRVIRNATAAETVEAFRVAALPHAKSIARQLGGKNLACWCRLGTPCHADVLLEIANGLDASTGNCTGEPTEASVGPGRDPK